MNEKFNMNLLLSKIEEKYNEPETRLKIIHFCKDIQIKVYRFNKIIEGKAYFETNEILRTINILNIPKEEIYNYFLAV